MKWGWTKAAKFHKNTTSWKFDIRDSYRKKSYKKVKDKFHLLRRSSQTIPSSLCGECRCLLMSYCSSHTPTTTAAATGIFLLLTTNFSHRCCWCCFSLNGANLLERIWRSYRWPRLGCPGWTIEPCWNRFRWHAAATSRGHTVLLIILQQLHVPFYILGLLLTSVLQSFPSRGLPRPFSQPNPSSKQHFSHWRCTPNPKTEKERKTDSHTNREISEPLQEEKAQRSKSRTTDPSAIRCHIHGNQSSYQLPKERRKLSEIRPDSLNYSLGNITAAHARTIL